MGAFPGIVYNNPPLVRFPTTQLRILEGLARGAAGLAAGHAVGHRCGRASGWQQSQEVGGGGGRLSTEEQPKRAQPTRILRGSGREAAAEIWSRASTG